MTRTGSRRPSDRSSDEGGSSRRLTARHNLRRGTPASRGQFVEGGHPAHRNVPETRRKYDPEFREGAVRIVRETGKPIAAGGQGSRDQPGDAWATGWTGTGSSAARRKASRSTSALELQQLRKDIAELRMERDVLKRSVVLWVKEATR